MRSGTFLYEFRFPTTFILSFFLWDAYFWRQRFVCILAHILTRGYVDCSDVAIRCPLRIGPTCVSNNLVSYYPFVTSHKLVFYALGDVSVDV